MEDREFLFTVYADSRAAEMARTGWAAAGIEAFLRSQFELQDTQYRRLYPQAEFLVIEVEGVAAGRLYVCRFQDRVQVMDIALLEPFRGRGIGTVLMQAVHERAAELGLPVRLYVEGDNAARRLYVRFGYRQIGEHGLYELMEWQAPVSAGEVQREED